LKVHAAKGQVQRGRACRGHSGIPFIQCTELYCIAGDFALK